MVWRENLQERIPPLFPTFEEIPFPSKYQTSSPALSYRGPSLMLALEKRTIFFAFLLVSLLDGVGASWNIKPWFAAGASHQGVLKHEHVGHQDEATRQNMRLPLPFPFRWSRSTTGFLALGDSYSAGIGTGIEGKEDECRHGMHAHPMLIFDDISTRLGPNSTFLQHLSCTGSTTDDVLAGGDRSQIDSINTTVPMDFALLSIGGNDLGFFEVMNACVFRFYSFYSGTCESALERADQHIHSEEFDQRLRMVILEVLDRVQWEKKPRFTVTVTGYARFFNAETDTCDDCSFGVWYRGPKLEKQLRQRMNDMVLAVNQKIRSSVEMINARFVGPSRVYFVDYDADFEGHRFCEPNITEPAYNRTDTWFFLVGGADNAPGSEPEAPEDQLSATSPLVDPETCLEPARQTGDWGELALCYMSMARQRDPTLELAGTDGMKTASSMWYVPTYYGKTFHPRSKGHEMIRDQIYKLWATIGSD